MINKQLQMQLEEQLAKLKQLPNELPVYQLEGYNYVDATGISIYYVDDNFESTEEADGISGIVI